MRVLWHQLAAHGQIKDGLAQGLNLVGTCGERDEFIEGEGGVVLKYSQVGIGRVETGEACRWPAGRASFPVLCAPSSSRSHSAISSSTFVHDAVLLGKGRERER